MELIEKFLLCFLPLFVAMDVLGNAPLFISITDEMTTESKNRLIRQAILTVFVISVIFLLSGKLVFNFLGITSDDFRIAGGLVLLVLAISDLVASPREGEIGRDPGQHAGVVPIGIPLIMGPAGLTTILILVENHGYWPTVMSLISNLIIVWLVFRNSDRIKLVLGTGGSKAFAKVASLFLAAIAVMMIRVGIQSILKT